MGQDIPIRTDDSRDGGQGPEKGSNSHRIPERGTLHEGKGGGIAGSRFQDLLELKDIFIAVKTTKKYHKSRLALLFQTWVSKAKEQVRSNGVIRCGGCSLSSV